MYFVMRNIYSLSLGLFACISCGDLPTFLHMQPSVRAVTLVSCTDAAEPALLAILHRRCFAATSVFLSGSPPIAASCSRHQDAWCGCPCCRRDSSWCNTTRQCIVIRWSTTHALPRLPRSSLRPTPPPLLWLRRPLVAGHPQDICCLHCLLEIVGPRPWWTPSSPSGRGTSPQGRCFLAAQCNIFIVFRLLYHHPFVRRPGTWGSCYLLGKLVLPSHHHPAFSRAVPVFFLLGRLRRPLYHHLVSLRTAPTYTFILCSGTSPPSSGLVPTPRLHSRPAVSMLGHL